MTITQIGHGTQNIHPFHVNVPEKELAELHAYKRDKVA
jgi:hypothetical protein